MAITLGIIIGIVMGLTGAGGALIAIPLFLHFLSMSLKEATLYSLVAVIIASFSNFIFQRKFTDFKLSIFFVVLSTLGSFLTHPYKIFFPDIGVAILLTLISIYSLYSVWKFSKKSGHKPNPPHWMLTALIGLTLGVLTTFTGLGGGVLMLPLLIGVYGFDQSRAVATSLFTVGLSSLSSLLIQVWGGAEFLVDEELLKIMAGIISSAYGIKILTSKLPSASLVLTRQIVFTLVVLIAMIKIFN